MKLISLQMAACIMVYAAVISCGPAEKESNDLASGTPEVSKTALHLAKGESEHLLQKLVGKWTAIESSFSDDVKFQGTMEVITAAVGHGLYTTYRQGSGSTYYEAAALLGFSESDDQVCVFEVNNLGVADTHVGFFDSDSSLHLERRDPNTREVMQQRMMRWQNDTLRMSAIFIADGKRSDHRLILVRQSEFR